MHSEKEDFSLDFCGLWSGTGLLPITVSGIYQAFKFQTNLDIIGVVSSLFAIYSVKSNWGREKSNSQK